MNAPSGPTTLFRAAEPPPASGGQARLGEPGEPPPRVRLDTYRGCQHGCPGPCPLPRGWLDPSTRLRTLPGAVAWLRPLQQGAERVDLVLGARADPYPAAEAERGATRALLERLSASLADDGVGARVRLRILTRSDLILRDLGLLRALRERCPLLVQVRLPGLDPDWAAHLEPDAPSPEARLDLIHALHQAGIPVGLRCEPLVPGRGDDSRHLRRLLCAGLEAGAGGVTARLLALPRGVRTPFLTWLGHDEPELARELGRLYRRGLPPARLKDEAATALRVLRRQYRMPPVPPWPPLPPPRQRSLFAQPPHAA